MSGEDEEGYEVGYCKPPKHTRFQPGQSGNPRGRPKKAKSFKADVTEELRERITVREGDRTRRVTKQRAIVKALVARALKGDLKAMAQVDSMMGRSSLFEGWAGGSVDDAVEENAAIAAALAELEKEEQDQKEREERDSRDEEGDED